MLVVGKSGGQRDLRGFAGPGAPFSRVTMRGIVVVVQLGVGRRRFRWRVVEVVLVIQFGGVVPEGRGLGDEWKEAISDIMAPWFTIIPLPAKGMNWMTSQVVGAVEHIRSVDPIVI